MIITDSGTAVTQTRPPAAPGAQPAPWQTTVRRADGTEIAGGEIGSILGSSIGNATAGGNVFAQIAASSVLGTLLQNVGQTFGYALDQNVSLEQAAYASFRNFDTELAAQVHSAGLGAISSYLTAELAESLGIHSTDFGGQLFSYAASTGINTILDYAIGNVAKSLNFTDGLGGALFGNGALNFDPATGFAKFLGGYIAHQIVGVENLGGSIGSTIGGYIGSAIGAALSGIGGATLAEAGTALLGLVGIGAGAASTAIGSITAGIAAVTGAAAETVGAAMAPFTFGLSIVVATVIGTLLGNALGDLFKDQGFGDYSMVLAPDSQRIVAGKSQTDDWDFGKPVSNMRQSALAVTNAVLAAVGGQLRSEQKIEIGFYYNDHPYMRTYVHVDEPNGTRSYNHLYDNLHHPDALLNYGVIEMLKRVDIAGGDLYSKRVLANTEATTIEQLMGELQIARDYETYLANKDVIDAIIMFDPTSAFAAGWIITLLKAEELGITEFQRSDFIGGVNAFLKGFDLARFGATLADVSLALDGSRLTLTIAQGYGRGDLEIALADYSSLTGLRLLPALSSGALVTGGDGDDLWIAKNVASAFTDTSTRLDTYSNDVLIGGAGNDTINAGVGADYIQGGAGNDSIDAGTGDDIIVGGTGDDTIQGGLGNDVYVFRRGDGADVIRDSGVAILRTGYVKQADGTYVIATMPETVLDVAMTTTATGTRSETWLVRATATTQYVRDGDGNIIYDANGEPLTEQVYDAIHDAQGHYILADATWTGATTAVLVENIDVYTEQATTTERTLTVGESLDGGHDVIQMGQGITKADLVARISGNDLILALKDPAHPDAAFDQLADRMTLVNWMDAASRVESVVFADGSSLDVSGILALIDRSGSDTITIADTGATSRGVTLDAGSGDDVITTGAGNDVVTGGDGADTISTGAGNDTIYAASGADHIDGGTGNDTIDYEGASLRVIVNLNYGYGREGSAAIEDVLSGIENVYGTAFNDTLLGDAGDNALWGREGTDSLNGGAGNDTLFASAGADTLNGASGIDIVDYSRVVLTSNAGVAVNLATGIGQSPGNAVADTLASIEGVVGSAGADTITGNSGANHLQGGGGNDTIDGGAGRDTIDGGAGDDVVVASTGGDLIDGGAGFDTLDYSGFSAAVSVDLTPVGDGDWTIQPTIAGNAQIVVQAGRVTQAGGIVDRLINVEKIIGTAFADTLKGDANANILDGAGGNDSMTGGAGNDTYVVDSSGDVVTEEFGGGTDTVQTSLATYTLAGNIENLTFTAAGNVTGTGNELANLITGGLGDDTLDGGKGNDTLLGGDGADNLIGGWGHDSLDGGAGGDIMAGGIGDDTYVVDDAADVVTEVFNGGTDEVRTTLSSYTLGAYVENLIHIGATAFSGTGNALANTLTGGSGANTLAGGAGNDIYYTQSAADVVIEDAGQGIDEIRTSAAEVTLAANVEKLTFVGSGNFHGTGNSGNNTITGGDGNDTLDGAGGNDTLVGGGGNDVYIIDSTSDVITEAFNGGDDEIRTTLASYTLVAAGVERLTYTGSASFAGAGNDLGNRITGGAGNDTLDGGAGDDTLVGGAGGDALTGGDGQDTADYSGSSAGVVVTLESFTLTTGYDADGYPVTIRTVTTPSSASGGEAAGDTLSDIENLRGSEFADTLTGNAVANELNGGAGNDTLSGAGGSDTYVFMRGSGQDVLLSTGNAQGTHDLLRFGPGIVASDLVARFVGQDLVIAVRDPLRPDQGFDAIADQVILKDWRAAGADQTRLQTIQLGATGETTTITLGLAGIVGLVAGLGGADFDGLAYIASYPDLFASCGANAAKGIASYIATGADQGRTVTFDAATYFAAYPARANLYNGNLASAASDYILHGYAAGRTPTGWMQSGNLWTGSDGRNVFVGTSANETIKGGDGDDVIDGGAGDDLLYGGNGADTLTGGAGIDTVRYDDAAYGAVTASLLDPSTNAGAAAGDRYVGIENITGGSGDDHLTGDDGGNALTGLAGTDVLDGGDGNDTLDGGAGNDTLIGGAGDDSYTVDTLGDVVIEAVDGGTDKVVSSTISLDLASYANVENASLTGTSNLTLTGTAGDNVLVGNGGNNTITGGDGNDVINGGAGADSLVGGAGDDIYTVDTLGDVVIEAVDDGTDKVVSSTISLDLASYANVENASLTGTSNLTLTGTAGDNTLVGNSGNNTITGGDGNDVINGGAGADSLIGGTGNDTYTVDNVGDVVVEAVDAGTDRVISSTISLDLASYANVENASLTGTANLALTGTAGNNVLIGNSGNNTITGGDGRDIITGGAGDDSLLGGDGNDVLRGGIGSDTLHGGAGSDTYILEVGDGQDIIYNDDNSTATTDTLSLSGFSRDTVWLAAQGSDLYVSIVGASDRVRIVDYFGDAAAAIDRIELDGGQYLDAVAINQLVQAMASDSNAGTGLANATITPSTIPSGVQTAIATAWHSS